MTERGPLLATTHQCTRSSTTQQRSLTIAELELVEVQSPQDLAPCLWLNEGHVGTHQGTDVTEGEEGGVRVKVERKGEKSS